MGSRTDWLEDLLEQFSALEGVRQEIKQYLNEEQDQFENALQEINNENFDEVAQALPQWFLVVPIEMIDDLPRRGKNALVHVTDKEHIVRVGRIRTDDLRAEDLLSLANFGRKSLKLLSKQLAEEARRFRKSHVRTFLRHLTSFRLLDLNPNVLLWILGGEIDETQLPDLPEANDEYEKQGELEEPSRSTQDAPNSLKSRVESVYQVFDPETVQMLIERWSEWDPPRKYGEVGQDHGISKTESWRKIKSVKEALQDSLGEDLEERIEQLLSSREEPLEIYFLGVEDEWFQGFEDSPSFFANFLDRLTSEEISVAEIQGHRIISHLSEEEWEQLQEKALDYLISQKEHRKLNRSDVKVIIENIAYRYEVLELAKPLFDEVRDSLRFIEKDGVEWLASIGSGSESAVEAVLQSASEPLHMSEIAKKCLNQYDVSLSDQSAGRKAAEIGVRFDRGTYGTWQHTSLDESERKQAIQLAETTVEDAPKPDRQWHAKEILKGIEKRNSNLGKSLNSYLICSLLKLSDRFEPLGYMSWKLKGTETGEKRIHLKEAVVAVLERANGPLSESEMRDRIEEYRGVGKSLNLNQPDRVVRVAPNQWGLVERDLNLSEEERKKTLKFLEMALSRLDEGIHYSEIPYMISEMGVGDAEEIPGRGVMEFAASKPSFKKSGEFLHLSDQR